MSASIAIPPAVWSDKSTPNEKDDADKLGSGAFSVDSGVSDDASTPVEFTAEEDARVRRKLDCVVMPLLFIGFYVFQLERGNISNGERGIHPQSFKGSADLGRVTLL